MSDPAATGARDMLASEIPDKEERVYFPELDGLRFVAFMMVYLFHQGIPPELLTRLIGHKAAGAILLNGGYGVQLFFILSGYLIASLLLREEARYGRISLQAFWVRRILRIWPLYYLVLLIGFFLLPALEREVGTLAYSDLMRVHLVPFALFLGNWSMALVNPVPYDWISVLWSVCIEEQFYLFVPLLIALVAPRYRRWVVGVLIVVSIAIRAVCVSYFSTHLMVVFNTFAQLDTLLSGVMLALVLGWDRNRPKLARWLRWLQWPLYALDRLGMSQGAMGQGSHWRQTWDFVWVWLCGLGVVVVAVWGNGWLRAALSYSRVVWLGKISYGLYMYHEIVLTEYRHYFFRMDWFPNKEELLSIATLAVTIALAAGSYYGFERRFLLLKRRWTRVASRPV